MSVAHPTDIFSIAATPTCLISASGSSSLKIYSITSSDFPLSQTIDGAHKLGCHHVATSGNGKKAASVGFGGEVKIWANESEDGAGQWIEEGRIVGGCKFPSLTCYGLPLRYKCRRKQSWRTLGHCTIRGRQIPGEHNLRWTDQCLGPLRRPSQDSRV